jgi:TetR/AcrR family transcriptional regulator, cholesterol catabolism regulator
MAVTAMKEGVSRFKRGLILAAAAKLFSERGYAATTIDAITEELKASKRAIYEHFVGKSDILVAICEQAVRFSVDLAERVRREPGDPATKLQRLAHDFTTIVIENQDYIAIASREMKFLPGDSHRRILKMQERFDRILAITLAEGVTAGVLDTPDPEMTGLAISGMIIWVHRWYRAGGRLTPSEIAERMAATALRMAAAPAVRGTPR